MVRVVDLRMVVRRRGLSYKAEVRCAPKLLTTQHTCIGVAVGRAVFAMRPPGSQWSVAGFLRQPVESQSQIRR